MNDKDKPKRKSASKQHKIDAIDIQLDRGYSTPGQRRALKLALLKVESMEETQENLNKIASLYRDIFLWYSSKKPQWVLDYLASVNLQKNPELAIAIKNREIKNAHGLGALEDRIINELETRELTDLKPEQLETLNAVADIIRKLQRGTLNVKLQIQNESTDGSAGQDNGGEVHKGRDPLDTPLARAYQDPERPGEDG